MSAMLCFRRGALAAALCAGLAIGGEAWSQAVAPVAPARAQQGVSAAQQGVADAHQGQYGAAIAAYRQALKLDPQLAGARMDLALAYFKTGQVEAAARNFQRYLALKPGAYRASLLLANCDLSLGRYADAVRLTAPFRASHPSDLALAYIRGTALIRSGQIQRGEVWINRIMKNGPSPVVHLMLGDAYRQNHKLKQAIAEYQQAVAMAPKMPLAHLWLAEAQLLSGQSAAALTSFQREFALDPNNYATNFYLGYLYVQHGDLAKAAPYLRRAHAMVPAAFQPAFQLALVEYRQGQAEAARQLLEPAVQRHPHNAQGHVILGEIYYRLHLPKKAAAQRAMLRQLVAAKQAQAIQHRQQESLQLTAHAAGGHR